MRRIALVLALAACARHRETRAPAIGAGDDPAGPPPPGARVFTCADGARFSLRPRGDSVLVTLDDLAGTERVLPRAGERWAGDGLTVAVRGRAATLGVRDATHAGCVAADAPTPWEEARLLGVEFRALGQEPGWRLDVDEGRALRYLGAYGTVRIATPAPPATVADDGTVTYAARTDAHALTVVVRPVPCTDAMSGAAFTHTVTVVADRDTVQGCGRALPTGALRRTHWRLLALGAAPAVSASAGAREAWLRLDDDGTAVGNTGCNGVRGSYTLAGDALRFGPAATTRMACAADGVMRQEQAFAAALAATDRFVLRADTLVLLRGREPVARFVAVHPR